MEEIFGGPILADSRKSGIRLVGSILTYNKLSNSVGQCRRCSANSERTVVEALDYDDKPSTRGRIGEHRD